MIKLDDPGNNWVPFVTALHEYINGFIQEGVKDSV